jgi:hypothetical protein
MVRRTFSGRGETGNGGVVRFRSRATAKVFPFEAPATAKTGACTMSNDGRSHVEEESTLPLGRTPTHPRCIPLLLVAGTGSQDDSAATPRRIIVLEDRLVIGRRPSARDPSLKIRDPQISREHARISRAPDGGFDLTDLESRNGTVVGARMASPALPLVDGISIYMGRNLLVFRYVSREELDALEEEQRAPFGLLPTLSPKLAMSLRFLRQHIEGRARGFALVMGGGVGSGREMYARAYHAALRGGMSPPL